MAGVAFLLKKAGHHVTGCDKYSTPRTRWLEACGIPVAVGHSPDHLDGIDELGSSIVALQVKVQRNLLFLDEIVVGVVDRDEQSSLAVELPGPGDVVLLVVQGELDLAGQLDVLYHRADADVGHQEEDGAFQFAGLHQAGAVEGVGTAGAPDVGFAKGQAHALEQGKPGSQTPALPGVRGRGSLAGQG